MAAQTLQSFRDITGVEESVARAYLSSCNDNLETAVSLYMDNPSLFPATNGNASSSDIDEVRAPIPQYTEQLLPNQSIPNSTRLAHRRAFVATGNSNSIPEASHSRQDHLGKLFAPPREFLFDGSIHEARAKAVNEHKWLLVSLHDDTCFDCHIMNRDIWKCYKVANLVKKNFIFMQPLVGSPDGFWYRNNFPYVPSASHLAVLDPNTGLEKCMWTHLKDSESVYHVLNAFCGQHSHNKRARSDDDDDTDSESKRSRLQITNRLAKVTVSEMSEDEQMRRALEESKKSTAKQIFSLSDDEDVEIDDDDEDEDNDNVIADDDEIVLSDDEPPTVKQAKSMEELADEMFPAARDSDLKLLIRMPDGNRQTLHLKRTMHFSKLVQYFAQLGFNSQDYELLLLHPRLRISLHEGFANQATLAEVGLKNSDTIYLQEI